MSNIPAELKYSKEHEWLRKEADGTYTVGITEHAQELLGDMVFIDLPEVGATVSAGDDCAVAESVKAASDIYAPVSGEIVAVNDALSDFPELVNSEPYAGGWIFKIKASDESELESLLDATAYEALLETSNGFIPLLRERIRVRKFTPHPHSLRKERGSQFTARFRNHRS